LWIISYFVGDSITTVKNFQEYLEIKVYLIDFCVVIEKNPNYLIKRQRYLERCCRRECYRFSQLCLGRLREAMHADCCREGLHISLHFLHNHLIMLILRNFQRSWMLRWGREEEKGNKSYEMGWDNVARRGF